MPLSYLKGVDWMIQPVIDKVYMLRDAMAASIGNLATQTEAVLSNSSQIQLSRWAEIVNGPNDPWVINFNFLGLDLSTNPSSALNYIMHLDFSHPEILALLLIPLFAVLSSWLSMKIMQKQSGQDQNNTQVNQTAKTMNMMMPIMTLVFTFTLPAGMGLYWIASSLMQILQQITLNLYFDKKGDEVVVKLPEQKKLHGAKSKKRK